MLTLKIAKRGDALSGSLSGAFLKGSTLRGKSSPLAEETNLKTLREKISYEEIGLFPRSFSRVFDRFVKQLFNDVENLVLQEYRFYRYLFLTTVKCLFILLLVPFLVNLFAKNYVVRPLTEYIWNTKQSQIFLNAYQLHRGAAELKNFEDKLYFESFAAPLGSAASPFKKRSPFNLKLKEERFLKDSFLRTASEAKKIILIDVSTQGPLPLSESKFGKLRPLHKEGVEGLEKKKGFCFHFLPPPTLFPFVLHSKFVCKNTKPAFRRKLSPRPCITRREANQTGSEKRNAFESQFSLPPEGKSFAFYFVKQREKASVFFWRRGFVPSHKIFECKNLKVASQDPRLKKRISSFSLFLLCKTKAEGSRPRSFYPKFKEENFFRNAFSMKLSGFAGLATQDRQSLVASNKIIRKQPLTKYSALQKKTEELAKTYNDESIEAITNFFADLISVITFFFLLVAMEIPINISKSFLLEVFFGLDDSKKSLLILLVTDLLVGYHSDGPWAIFFEYLFNHYGLPESQTGIFLLVATLPVLLDVLFKYLIFRHLNRASPATVATYHAMIE